MKIIDYYKNLDKNKIADLAYKICGNAEFPVEYQDVYEHLFGKDNLILKLLVNEEESLAGFGVFENYKMLLNDQVITMLYLSGMVIDPKYQGRNISQEMIKNTYMQLPADLISLRTQNIIMAKSLLNTFDDNLFVMPGDFNDEIIKSLRQVEPFKNIDENGIIRNCYPNQLYYNLKRIQDNFDIELQSNDALGVVIEPSQNKKKSLSLFR